MPLKNVLVKGKELFCWWEVSKFLHAALFANAGKLDVKEFHVKIESILRSRPRKPMFLFFIERLLAGTIHVTFLIYLKAIFHKKVKKSIFQLLPRKQSICSIFSYRRS